MSSPAASLEPSWRIASRAWLQHGATAPLFEAPVQHYAGGHLDRCGPLRTNKAFLDEAFIAARLAVHHSRNILYTVSENETTKKKQTKLALLDHSQLQQLVGKKVDREDKDVLTVLLGRDDSQQTYWAVDVTNIVSTEQFEATASTLGYTPLPLRPASFLVPSQEAAIVAQASALIDWNRRYKHCPGCGKEMVADEAGYKRICSAESSKCSAHSGVQNFCYPRTDVAVIFGIISRDGKHLLLGRKENFPWFSTLAGFLEPGESLEEAVRREALEEAGVQVGEVHYIASQPWPYPGSIMVGFLAHALTDDIVLNDKELESAHWFSVDEVGAALDPSQQQDPAPESESESGVKSERPVLKVPIGKSIAYTIIKGWHESANSARANL